MRGTHASSFLVANQVVGADIGKRGNLGFDEGAINFLTSVGGVTMKKRSYDGAVCVEACGESDVGGIIDVSYNM